MFTRPTVLPTVNSHDSGGLPSVHSDRRVDPLALTPLDVPLSQMWARSSQVLPQVTPDPGSTLATAYNLGLVGSAPVQVTDAVSVSDRSDLYRFNIASSSQFSLTLTDLRADLDVRLIRDANSNGVIDAGEELARSDRGGTTSETINLANFGPGTYFVEVFPYRSASSNYRLSLTATTTLPTIPDNSLDTARDLGTLSTNQTIPEFVGQSDPQDFFRFSLNRTSTLTLDLTGLRSDADIRLRNLSGTSIAFSLNPRTESEQIQRVLSAGTYYIEVFQAIGDTSYSLELSITAVDSSTWPTGYSPIVGYGLVNAAAAVAAARGQSPYANVSNLGGDQWDLDQINAPEVWAQGITGQGITVAVIDTGVNSTHPDLDSTLWRNPREIVGNGLDDDGNGFVDDVNGWDFVDNDNLPWDDGSDTHGTHVAGTIAAENNGQGNTGVAYGARIMPIRVLSETGGTSANVAAGIRYATRNGARVINLSLGGGSFANDIANAVQAAIQQGVVVVMAAGNASGSSPEFPASLASSLGLSVGAVDRAGQIADFSNVSGLVPINYVMGPGVGILSTLQTQSYGQLNGTSMATPHIAGVAALILSANPSLSAIEVINLITRTASRDRVTV